MSDSIVPDLTRFNANVREMQARFVREMARVLPGVVRAMHGLRHATEKPVRCATCHPRANPKPLCIDGAAYRRRTKGRKR